MPNTQSAKKRIRQTVKRNARNQWRKRLVKDHVKTFLQAIQEQDVPKAEEEFRRTCGILDKVACTSTMHRNTAARRKSRLSRRLVDLKKRSAGAA